MNLKTSKEIRELADNVLQGVIYKKDKFRFVFQ